MYKCSCLQNCYFMHMPWSEHALIPHANHIIITEWNIFARAIYSAHINNHAKCKIFFS